jgi:rod shape-determining protein MreC
MLRALIERLRVPLLLLLLVALALLAIASDRRALARGDYESGWLRGVLLEVASPVQRALSAPVDGVRNTWSHYVALRGVRVENDRLRERLAQLEEENLQFREALVEGGRLRTIAEMRRDVEIPMRPAQVVGMDVSPWFHSVLIDRGRSDGVRAGMPVVTEDGVVGIITATAPDAARTLLLLDAQSSIDGIVQRSRARGIVRGEGSDELSFEFVARGSDVQVDDQVITSGLDGVYPKGLLIGTVDSVSEDGAQLIRTATIRPAVDFGRLEQVFVMLRRGPTMELLYSTRVGDDPSDDGAEEPAS